jgi:hypothetical protein
MDLQYACPTVIIEMGHGSVLCKSRTVSSANATVKGLFNTTARMVPTQLAQFAHVKELDFDNKFIIMNIRGEVKDLPEHLITPEYLDLKKLAKLRNDFLWSLETRLQEGIWRLHDFYEPTLEAFLISELANCNPETNEYTDALYEYASVSDIDVATVYQELKMKTRTSGLIRLRNRAIYDKYVRIMNTANTREELVNVMKDALYDAYVKQQL